VFALGLLGACDTEPRLDRDPHPDPDPGLRWPADWEPHEATLMSTPWQRSIYGRRLEAMQEEWAAVARTIAEFEPVTMIVPAGSSKKMRRLLGRDVDLLELWYDDGWLRDSGPIFVTEGLKVVGLDWTFNGWGGAFDRFGQTWEADDAMPAPLCRALDVERRSVPMVLEGGSVLSDGAGTILTTEECLLDQSRNPDMSKAEIERALLDNLGGSKVVWLPFGLIGDLTGGHVDGVAMPIGPGRVLAQTDPADPEEGERLEANLEVLRSATDASDRPFEVIELPLLPRSRFAGGPKVQHTYLNLTFSSGAVVVPLADLSDADEEALAFLRDVLPDREILGVPTPSMTWAGGGVHCITQPLPAVG
jgi:agmatine deiminase